MKKILSKVSMLLAGLIIGITITACATDVTAEQTRPLKIWYENKNGKMQTYCLVDENTGVNYVVVVSDSTRGLSTSITPRLNADGTLYINK